VQARHQEQRPRAAVGAGRLEFCGSQAHPIHGQPAQLEPHRAAERANALVGDHVGEDQVALARDRGEDAGEAVLCALGDQDAGRLGAQPRRRLQPGGGLGLVVIVTTAIFGAISGMASSAVAAIGTIMIPRMEKRGSSRAYAASLVANSSVLALLIPPSASMIIYGWVTGTSITAAFLAPVVPGLVLVLLFAFWNRILTRSMPIVSPSAVSGRELGHEIVARTRRAGFGLLMPAIILGFIYGGITTPTEAAAVAVVYAIPISICVYRGLGWRSLYDVLWRTGQTTGVLMVLVFFAAILGRLFTMENVPQGILAAFTTISEDPVVILLLVNLFLLLIGMFMEDISGILLAAPILAPVVQSVGVDPVHFAAIIATNLGMGLITPPTAPLLYFGALIGKTPLGPMLKPTLVFVLFAYLPVVLLTTFIPTLSLTLPRLVLGIG
jgi:C4-dicarboxylate transporter DctM subunit